MKKKIIIYSIAAAISLLFSFGLAFYRGVFAATDTKILFSRISDCFFVPGFLFIAIGVLMWIASQGFFDLLTYGTKNLPRLFSAINKGTTQKDFYEYKVAMAEKRSKKKPHTLFWVGLSDMLIFAVIYIIYLNM